MWYNHITSFSLLVTELNSLGSWGGIHSKWVGSSASNVEGISVFVLEFLQNFSHAYAQKCLFWHVAPRQV